MTVCTHLSTHEVCDLLGLTFRQLDYVSRTVLRDAPGSGYHRRWDTDTIDRLTVAKALLGAIDALVLQKNSPWPQLVEAVMGSETPASGWVTLSPAGDVTYHGQSVPAGEVGISTRWEPVRGEVRA